jgi:predicted nuclease of predicted toxin-antitoxin system
MLRLLTDEDVHGDIIDGLKRCRPTIDVVRVQDVGLRQQPDPVVLDWAAANNRVVVSVDKKTLTVDAWQRVAQGLPMPGVAILRLVLSIGQAIDELELIAVVAEPDDFRDRVIFLPMQ